MDSRAQKPRVFSPISVEVEQAGKAVLDAAYRVHTALGPGLLESVYEPVLPMKYKKADSKWKRKWRYP